MFCSKCGKQAEGEFCWNCGEKLYMPSGNNEVSANNALSVTVSKKRELASYDVFMPTKSYVTMSGKFEIDESHQMMRLVPNHGNEIINFHYQDIVDAELVRNESSVYKTSTASMLTRAALGSLISGGMSIIAGATAKKNENTYIDSLYLRIYIKNNTVPTVNVYFVTTKTLADSFVGNVAMSTIETVLGQIKIAQTEQPKELAYAYKPNRTATNSTPSKLKWRCPHCDYLNSNNTCVSCGANKPAGVSYVNSSGEKIDPTRAVIPSSDEYSIRSKDEWYCTFCDYKNRGANKSCSNCGASKEDEEIMERKGFLSWFTKKNK